MLDSVPLHFHVPCVPHDKPKVSTKSQQRQGKGRAAYGGFETDWFQASEVERAQRVEVGTGLCICLDRLPEWVLCCGLVELCSYQCQMSVIAFRLPSCICIVDSLAELSFLQNCSCQAQSSISQLSDIEAKGEGSLRCNSSRGWRSACALGHLVLVAGRDADEFGVLFVARGALELEHERVVLVSGRQTRYVGELRLELQCETLSTKSNTVASASRVTRSIRRCSESITYGHLVGLV